MLRISTQDDRDLFTLKLEGKVIGDWAEELESFWGQLKPSLDTRKLCLDIRGVMSLDSKGRKVLRQIIGPTNADILADSPLTKQFAAEARQKNEGRDGHAHPNV